MKPKVESLLLHPLFIISLSVLFLNDINWKYSYSNWLTGKLSDVAGLIVLPMLLRELFPKFSRWIILMVIAVFFTWWKSSFSQSFIDYCNNVLQLPVARVIDYSDLFALPVLMVGFTLKPKSVNRQLVTQCLLHNAAAFVAFFTLCATSMPYQRGLYLERLQNEVYFFESFKIEGAAEDILQTLKRKNIAFKRDSIEYAPVANQPFLYHRTFNVKDSTVSFKRVDIDSTLFIRRESFPYYLIQGYEAGEIKLWRIKFRMEPNKKNTKTTITVESFQTANSADASGLDKKRRKIYRQFLEQLFR
jgi:hypothetical protein